MGKKVILSGIQPSGELMIGNYLGSIKQWVKLQEQYECFFPIVNLHAITVRQSPEELEKRTIELAAQYMALGINPKVSTIFIQSQVEAHSELAWLLSCNTYLGEVNRMTQFKEKSAKSAQNIGLLTYPILMAADILLYQADLVPVGEDQTQHLELCRLLAKRINVSYKSKGKLFKVPEPYIPEKSMGGRIMSLQNPEQKMSKSDSNPNSYIKILDDDKSILKKIKSATTDSGSEIIYDAVNKPGISNLLTLYSILSNKSISALEQEYQGKQYGHFKKDLAELTVDYLKPIKDKYYELITNKDHMHKVLKEGMDKARERANKTLNKVKNAMGLFHADETSIW